MSVFNSRKDRFPNGKAKPHNLKARDRFPTLRAYFNKSSSDWNRLYTTKRRRANDKEKLHKVIAGYDADGIAWSPDNYPTLENW